MLNSFVEINSSVKVDLPSIGTNLQDQALNILEYLPPASVNASFFDTTNEPISTAVAFLNLSQIVGGLASEFGNLLQSTVTQRAKAVVDSGAFTSQEGLVKAFSLQARSIIAGNGRCF